MSKLETQKIMIEEKYNIKAKKDVSDPKKRVLLKMINEFEQELESGQL